jgi:hypothetical protein
LFGAADNQKEASKRSEFRLRQIDDKNESPDVKGGCRMNKEPDHSYGDAKGFLEAEHEWLVGTGRRAAQRVGLQNHGDDIANEASKKVMEISDAHWAGMHDQKAYVATIIFMRSLAAGRWPQLKTSLLSYSKGIRIGVVRWPSWVTDGVGTVYPRAVH